MKKEILKVITDEISPTFFASCIEILDNDIINTPIKGIINKDINKIM